MTVRAYAAREAGAPLEPFTYEFTRDLGGHEVEIAVSHCGICYSDVSMIDNEWGMTTYPIVPGHEAIGRIVAKGTGVGLAIGQTVGVGWNAASCGTCEDCLGGDDNMCARAEGVIVGRHGGFADRLRVSERFAIPVPDGLDPAVTGPLLCGGVTVYNPLKQFHVRPSERVGIVGIGGLGHMAIQFARAWGCDVTAFSHSADKEGEARRLGAHAFVGTHDTTALQGMARSLDVLSKATISSRRSSWCTSQHSWTPYWANHRMRSSSCPMRGFGESTSSTTSGATRIRSPTSSRRGCDKYTRSGCTTSARAASSTTSTGATHTRPSPRAFTWV